MRNYEVMFILRPETEQEAVQAAVEKFHNIINAGGEVVKSDLIGKKRLAYEINKIREGIYVLVHFNAKAETVAELERVLKITDEVIRYLIIKKEVA
jgi:small subunit ribosomal protein S6